MNNIVNSQPCLIKNKRFIMLFRIFAIALMALAVTAVPLDAVVDLQVQEDPCVNDPQAPTKMKYVHAAASTLF